MNYTYLNEGEIQSQISELKKNLANKKTVKNLKSIFTLIDLTSLNPEDHEKDILSLTNKVNGLSSKHDMQNVAAICVFPPFVSRVKENLKDKNVNIAAVSAGFPSSQTFLAIKIAETEIAIKKGADEIDIVLSLGKFLNKDLKYCSTEIAMIKHTVKDKHLKVILETGVLKSIKNIYDASILSMEAGADFIKTSTGKTSVSATPEAVYAMCLAIKNHYEQTGVKKGIKASGGIGTSEDALLYYSIVEQVLGNDWLNNKLFRFGASRLANNILKDICDIEGRKFETYF